MELNDKTISEIAIQLGLSGQEKIRQREIERLSSKSDAELEREILKLKESLKKNNIGYEKQMEMLRSIEPMMDAKQKARLKKVMAILRK